MVNTNDETGFTCEGSSFCWVPDLLCSTSRLGANSALSKFLILVLAEKGRNLDLEGESGITPAVNSARFEPGF